MNESPQSPCTLGDLQLIREASRGQMAIVYEAHQISMKRRVATKVLSLALTLRPHFVQAFRNECQIMALLHHINLVPVFSLSCFRGVYFIVMEYVEGRSLDKFLQEPPNKTSTFRSIANVFVQAA